MTTHPVPVARGDRQSSELPDNDNGPANLASAAARLAPALPRRVPGAAMVIQDAADDRAERIQGIRDYADWLEANPDVPAPDSVDGHSHNVPKPVAAAFAAAYHGIKHQAGITRWVVVAPPQPARPFTIRHTAFLPEPPQLADGWTE
jgi:hypothetical protein